jgi:hypothetical protein
MKYNPNFFFELLKINKELIFRIKSDFDNFIVFPYLNHKFFINLFIKKF